tara:strand:+ start:534 stop:905 length:372 start_codon:yes stop_codon:yes gene_type:complete
MRFSKSEIEEMKGVKPAVKQEKEEVELSVDAKDEILAAIKSIKPAPSAPVVKEKMTTEILTQQKAMMAKLSEVPLPPNFPSYHFEINRASDGYIKSVDATPTNVDNKDTGKSWYKKAQDWYKK